MTSKIVVNNIEPDAGISTVSILGIATATKFIGDIEGGVTGNVTGNVTGSSGSCTGNAATATVASGITTTASVNTSGIVTATAFVPTTGQLSHRNIIVNGAMLVAQRGVSSTTNGYGSVDRFQGTFSATDESPTHTQHTLTSSDTGPYAEGFRKSFHVQNGNQTGGAGASDFIRLWHKIEAQDLANSGWNYTSSSSYITLSFWVKASVTQTYYVQMRTAQGTSKSYYFAMNLSANTWTKVTHSIPGHADLTFGNDTGEGIYIAWYTFRGTNNTGTVTANQWNNWSGSTITPDQTTTWYTTNDSTFEITGVQLEVGTVSTPFEHRSVGDELTRCQRYYQQYVNPCCTGVIPDNGSKAYSIGLQFQTRMRATPTTAITNAGTGGNVSDGQSTQTIASLNAADGNVDGMSIYLNLNGDLGDFRPACLGLNDSTTNTTTYKLTAEI